MSFIFNLWQGHALQVVILL